jgi:ATP-dependent DNA helicase PIF1
VRDPGLTIDWLEVSLAAVFEVGQAYVALSRARSLDGLRVLSFDPRAVRTHAAVIDFYGRFAPPASIV